MFHWFAKHWKTIAVVAASTVAFVAVTALTGGLGAAPMLAVLSGGFASGVTGSIVAHLLDGQALSLRDAVVQGTIAAAISVATLGVGRLLAPFISRSMAPTASLIHLTSTRGAMGIDQSGQLIGRSGIFALPERAAMVGRVERVVRTGLPASKTMWVLRVPETATSLFKRPVPIGPYSFIKWAAGVRYAPAGSIDMATGVFTPTRTLLGPRAVIYGPDVAAWAVVSPAIAAHVSEAVESSSSTPPPSHSAPSRTDGLAGALGGLGN